MSTSVVILLIVAVIVVIADHRVRRHGRQPSQERAAPRGGPGPRAGPAQRRDRARAPPCTTPTWRRARPRWRPTGPGSRPRRPRPGPPRPSRASRSRRRARRTGCARPTGSTPTSTPAADDYDPSLAHPNGVPESRTPRRRARHGHHDEPDVRHRPDADRPAPERHHALRTASPPYSDRMVATGPSQVPAATRALRVLRFLASQTDPVPLDRIARACDLPRSTAYHLVNTMIDEGFVDAPRRRPPLRPGHRGVRGRQRVRPPGAPAADRAPAAGGARRPHRPERAPRGAARPRRALRPRGAGSRAAAAGHRRRASGSRPSSPRAAGRSSPRCPRPRCGRCSRTGRVRASATAAGRPRLSALRVAADRDPAARPRRRGRRGDAGLRQRRRAGARPQRAPGRGGRLHLPERRGRRRAGRRGPCARPPPGCPSDRRPSPGAADPPRAATSRGAPVAGHHEQTMSRARRLLVIAVAWALPFAWVATALLAGPSRRHLDLVVHGHDRRRPVGRHGDRGPGLRRDPAARRGRRAGRGRPHHRRVAGRRRAPVPRVGETCSATRCSGPTPPPSCP